MICSPPSGIVFLVGLGMRAATRRAIDSGLDAGSAERAEEVLAAA